MKKIVCLFTMLFMVTSILYGTSRFYSNITSQSPNGKYEAEAKSPNNENIMSRIPFQNNFTITFRDTKTRKQLWQWKQNEKDACPVTLIPTDNGRLIVLDAWSNYYIFDSKGVKTNVLNILKNIPKEEKKKYTDFTTAGIFWKQFMQEGFFIHEKRPYYYIRLYWGRTFVFNISQSKLVADQKIIASVEKLLVNQTKIFLKNFNGKYNGLCSRCKEVHVRDELKNAAFIIKKNNIDEGKAILKMTLSKEIEYEEDSDFKRYLDLIKPNK